MAEDIFWVSNSEAIEYQTCKRKYYYSYSERLQPKYPSMPLIKGNMGHDLLEAYYKGSMLGLDGMEPLKETFLSKYKLTKDPEQSSAMLETYDIVRRYLKESNPFHAPIEVETTHRVPLDGRVGIAFRIDLIDGTHGRRTLVDHKFTARAFTDRKIATTAQLYKYTRALALEGEPVYRTLINEISTKRNATYPNTIYEIQADQDILHNYMTEHTKTANEIADWHDMTLEEQEAKATRSFNWLVCQYCAFFNLCQNDLTNRRDKHVIIETEFEPNEYGYRDE